MQDTSRGVLPFGAMLMSPCALPCARPGADGFVAACYILLCRPLIGLFNRNPAVIDYGAKLLVSQVALYPALGSVI